MYTYNININSMIHLICKRLVHSRPVLSNKAHGSFFSTSSLKSTSDGLNPTDRKSLTVSYLLNSCGLSLDPAISASKKLKLTSTTDQLKSVLELLKSHGLSQTHIKKMVTTRPQILLADLNKTLKPNFDSFASMGLCGSNLVKVLNRDPRILESDVNAIVEFFRGYGFNEKQISLLTMKRPNLYWYDAPKISKPKLEYFKSLGFSGAEMAQMLSSEPYILERSLENHIMPSVEVIRRVVGTNDNVLKVIKSCYRLIEYNLVEVLEPNIEILINHGVPESKILQLIMIQPRAMLLRTGQFSEVVEKVVKLGFDPENLLFVLAIRTMATMSKSLWERKCIVLRSFGWSGDEIISAFKLLPMCMSTSEKKIRKLMGFFVNVLKLKPSVIAKKPNLLLYSFEKRIIPRCSVLQLLMSKDLIKGDFCLVNVLRMNEKRFVEKYVSKYQKLIPKVIKAHQGKIQFQGFPTELKI